MPADGHLFIFISVFNPSNKDKKHPKALVLSFNTPSTFSQSIMVFCFPLIDLTISFFSIISTSFKVKLPLSSPKPFFQPASENAWQGVPPQIKSGASIFF